MSKLYHDPHIEVHPHGNLQYLFYNIFFNIHKK